MGIGETGVRELGVGETDHPYKSLYMFSRCHEYIGNFAACVIFLSANKFC